LSLNSSMSRYVAGVDIHAEIHADEYFYWIHIIPHRFHIIFPLHTPIRINSYLWACLLIDVDGNEIFYRWGYSCLLNGLAWNWDVEFSIGEYFRARSHTNETLSLETNPTSPITNYPPTSPLKRRHINTYQEIGEVRLAFKTNIRLSLIWHENTHLQYISSPCDIRLIRSWGTIPATSFQPIHVLTLLLLYEKHRSCDSCEIVHL
jgi:hypothetical protein